VVNLHLGFENQCMGTCMCKESGPGRVKIHSLGFYFISKVVKGQELWIILNKRP